MMVEKINKHKQAKIKPECVLDHVDNMGGVDGLDQFTSYYSTPRKTIRWYNKAFIHLLDISVNNAYILFKEVKKQSGLPILKFRDALILQLTGYQPVQEPTPRLIKANSSATDYEKIDTFHIMECIPLAVSNTNKTRF